MKICSFVGAAGSALFTMPFQHTYILCDTEFGSATGGLYGIGMKVDTSPPHRVQAVTKLLDPEVTKLLGERMSCCFGSEKRVGCHPGQSANSKVAVGDILMSIDGVSLVQASSAPVSCSPAFI
eukprot:3939754-Rhodomonas_salina.3